jgi:ABC-type sugar transport system permease subunit
MTYPASSEAGCVITKISMPRRPNAAKALPWLLLAPSLLVIGVVQLYPAVYSVWLSFQKIAGARTTPVGLRNYALVFGSRAFADSAWHTVFFLLGYVALTLLLGLAIALLLNRGLKLRSLYAALLFVLQGQADGVRRYEIS